jgi:hypothetical protein
MLTKRAEHLLWCSALLVCLLVFVRSEAVDSRLISFGESRIS